MVAKYWADAINNAYTVSGILHIQDWMSQMADSLLKAQAASAAQHTSQVPPTTVLETSQDEGPEIAISSAPTFGLDDDEVQEVNKPSPSDDDLMMFDEGEESSGSHHSTSKPKKKKKNAVTRKEFLSLQAKVDQILAAVKPTQPQPEDVPGPQSLIERIERLEARE